MSDVTIRVLQGDVEVTGEIILRTRSDIRVAITRPFHNLTAALHIPYFACPKVGYLGEHGDSTARHLLLKLYEAGRILDKHFEELRHARAMLPAVFCSACRRKVDSKFFNAHFGTGISWDLQEQMKEILAGKKSFRSVSTDTAAEGV